MTQQEKDTLSALVQMLENLTVKVDALEGALIGVGVLSNGVRDSYESNYRLSAVKDMAYLRGLIANLPLAP